MSAAWPDSLTTVISCNQCGTVHNSLRHTATSAIYKAVIQTIAEALRHRRFKLILEFQAISDQLVGNLVTSQ